MSNLINSVYIQISLVFITGLLFTKISNKLKLPSVTGYLVGGLLLGPYVLNIITKETVENLEIFSNIALGFIAFSIGNEFKLSYFKRVGVMPIVIACLESFFAVLYVFIAMILFKQSFQFSLMIGAIAAATAPAATIMVIKQYKAKGPVTETLLSVVAIDDATALILFGFALAIVNSGSSNNSNLFLMLLSPLLELFISFIIGVIIGIIFSYIINFFKENSIRNPLIISIVLMSLGISNYFKASTLMVCMIVGAVFCNLSNKSDEIINLSEKMTPALFMMFFVLSGAELNILILPTIGFIGVVYVISRIIGKCFGAYLGAKLCSANENIQKYLGPCLIPQAGVAIGLSLVAESAVSEHGSTIRAIILCATLIYEIFGPFITKVSLTKAKEII
ncbi:MAG: cation:proton antiporter [Erysipelotrichaceae bacterium]|nr:cation:proton antiporter [Erysipelotrichaceae bacterium]